MSLSPAGIGLPAALAAELCVSSFVDGNLLTAEPAEPAVQAQIFLHTTGTIDPRSPVIKRPQHLDADAVLIAVIIVGQVFKAEGIWSRHQIGAIDGLTG